jgi:hypothetical protein
MEDGSAAAPVPILTPVCANVVAVASENNNATRQNFNPVFGLFLRMFTIGFILGDYKIQ